MKERFQERLGLNQNNRVRLGEVNGILEEYAAEGYRLTLRQLYYQLVSRDLIPNNQREYAKLSNLLKKGRMGGVVDWDIIEDRIRAPYIPYYVRDVPGALEDTIDQYRLNRMEDQKVYIEIWVEKDALSGVLKPITSYYHINLMVNRGYSSCTAMYDASKRILRKQGHKLCFIFYLGDHDPSGLDMVRDIRDRLAEFGADPDVRPITLTSEQIKKYNPPPNPAKFQDPRANDYIAKFGRTSWEVDALNPKTLNRLVQGAVEGLLDRKKFNAKLKQEEKDKKILRTYAEKLKNS